MTYEAVSIASATVSLAVGGIKRPLFLVCKIARKPVTLHEAGYTWNPVMVTETVWPFSNGPHVGASGRFCPQ